MPKPPPDPTVAWNKVRGYPDKRSDELHDLDEGGVVEAVRMARWKPSRLDKVAESTRATRDAIDGAMAWLKAGPR